MQEQKSVKKKKPFKNAGLFCICGGIIWGGISVFIDVFINMMTMASGDGAGSTNTIANILFPVNIFIIILLIIVGTVLLICSAVDKEK